MPRPAVAGNNLAKGFDNDLGRRLIDVKPREKSQDVKTSCIRSGRKVKQKHQPETAYEVR
jgi:hypothetical protein